MREAGVDLVAAPAGATELVLLAHGGEENSFANPHAWRAPILRMWPFATTARSAAPHAAVGLMRYRYRGWNGDAESPAADLRTVIDTLPSRISRVLLIGHSMGGRAVVATGNHPLVAGVLALAPWLPTNEPLTPLRGLVVFAHGTNDRITDPALTAAYADRLRTTGTPVAMSAVEGDTHAMLHRAADWNTLTHHFTTTALTPPKPRIPTNPSLADHTPADSPPAPRTPGDSASASRAPSESASADRESGDSASLSRTSGDSASASRAPGDSASVDCESADRGASDFLGMAVTTELKRVDLLPGWNPPASVGSAVASIARARFATRLTHW